LNTLATLVDSDYVSHSSNRTAQMQQFAESLCSISEMLFFAIPILHLISCS